jgi:hypothetical protein
MNRLRLVLASVFITGALVPVVAQRAQFPNLWIPVLIAIVAGLLSGWLVSGRAAEAAAAGVFGVFVGLTVDAIVDWFYFAHDRRLIGIEWIVWAAVMGLPVAIASWCGGALRAHRQQRTDKGAV